MAQILAPFYGRGIDGILSQTSPVTDAPVDSSMSVTAATRSISATNASFASGRIIGLHQSRGGNGDWELAQIQSYSPGTITTSSNIVNTFVDSGDSQAQVIQLKEYSKIYLSAQILAKAWDGNVGGLLWYLCNGETILDSGGIFNASGKGFRGGLGSLSLQAYCGEGSVGASKLQRTSNGNGGGGGAAASYRRGAGAGGAGAVAGNNGGVIDDGLVSSGGLVTSLSDLTKMFFGGGGGGSQGEGGSSVVDGAIGGGLMILFTRVLRILGGGYIKVAGNDAPAASFAGAGNGAGGNVLIMCEKAYLGTDQFDARGGQNSVGTPAGGLAGKGKIRIVCGSYTGSISSTYGDVQIVTGGYSWLSRVGIL